MLETKEEFGNRVASSFGIPYHYLQDFCDTLYEIISENETPEEARNE